MFKRIVFNIIALIFSFFPRNNKLWITGKITSWDYDNTPPAFFDNSKYFFLYLVNNTDEEVYWLSSSKEEIDLLKSMNLPVVKYPSIKGFWLVLRSKFSFHHYGPNQIEPIFQKGSVQIDFWHGTPLKKIRYDVVEKPKEKHNIVLDWIKKDGIEYVSSTSKYLTNNILQSAFKLNENNFLNFGYPRTDIMNLNKEESYAFCKKYSKELLQYIDIANSFDKVFLYMPTFRDDNPDYFNEACINFDLLSTKLKSINGVIFIKLHPLTKQSEIKNYNNIISINNDVDIYPFLTYTDILITDYSSIYFDFLLIDREIIFIPYDYNNYTKNRNLYFDYDIITPGVKYYSFDNFINNIENVDEINYSEERNKVRSLIIENYNFDASIKVYNFIKEKYM